MKPSFPNFSDDQVKKMATRLQALLSNVSLDNFAGSVVSGTTSSSANTERMFRHALGGQPAGVFVLEGNAYVQRNGVGPETLDVRSNGTNEEFLALVFK